MSTPFSDIYDIFLGKITDYDFLAVDDLTLEDTLQRYLLSASVKFLRCSTDLSRDTTLKLFTNNLTYLEQEILASLMVVEWLSPKLNTSQLLKQTMTDKDFKIYSQANHLDELIKLRQYMQDEVDGLINVYTYQDIGDLK
jgi:hypothetical protein